MEWETPTPEQEAAFRKDRAKHMSHAPQRERSAHREYPWTRDEPSGVLHGLEDLIEQNEPDMWDSLPERVDPATGLPRCSSDEEVENIQADERVARQAVVDSLLCMAAYIGKGLDKCPASFAAEAARAYEFINPENKDDDRGESGIAVPPPLTP